MRCAIILAVSIFLIFPAAGYSATYYVPKDFGTIQEAIDACVGGDVVIVSPGTYVEKIDFKGKAITVKSEQGQSVTVIDGNDSGSVVTFKSGEGLDSVLDGFTVTNGSGTIDPTFPQYDYIGGGIYCKKSSPTIMNNIVTNNLCDSAAGIACLDGSDPKIMKNEIIENTADGAKEIAGAGGISVGYHSDPEIVDNLISENEAVVSGGGMMVAYNSSPIIKNNTISNNEADGAGGIGIFIDCSGMLEGNIISDNYSTDMSGGIWCASNSTTTFSNNLIIGNTAGTHGGGLYIDEGCDVTFMNNLIFGNTAGTFGGGFCIYAHNTNTNNVTVMNNTVFGNSAADGGGIACKNALNLEVTNTILWNNTATKQGSEIYIEMAIVPSTVTISYSDVEGGKSSCHVDPNCTLNWGTGWINADPLFAQGPNGFYYLSQVAAGQPADSPCVDTGSDLASNLGMDIYWTRTDEVPDSGIVDMGFHYGPFTFPALQTDTFWIPESTGGDADLLLIAGSGNANRNYILLGSVTGTDPGTPLPGGHATLPVNWDIFTNLVVDFINTPVFSNFMGPLNAKGSATAIFDSLAPIPGAAGLTLHFAYALNNPWDFVSNPVGIEILP